MYLVETKEGMFIGEYNTSREVAQAIGASPAKTNMAIKRMTVGEYNRLGEFRIGVKR